MDALDPISLFGGRDYKDVYHEGILNQMIKVIRWGESGGSVLMRDFMYKFETKFCSFRAVENEDSPVEE